MFNIINLKTNEMLRATSGEIIECATGQDAATCARAFSAATGVKHQPRRVVNAEWRDRELGRFSDCTYIDLPWIAEAWFQRSILVRDHFAHVALAKPGYIAFTESPEKGTADIQTRMRAARYLTKFYPELGKTKIRDLACEFSTRFEENRLLFAETADEIEEVYLTGPNSCMGSPGYRAENEWRPYTFPIHPTRAYAGHFKLAYLVREGSFTARGLVWITENTHSRLYGDDYRLETLLRDVGVRWAPPFGAKIQRIPNPKGGARSFIVPFIDKGSGSRGGSCYVRDDNDPVSLSIVCENWNAECADQLSGVLTVPSYRDPAGRREVSLLLCGRCGDETEGDELFTVWTHHNDTQRWCENCRNSYATRCDDLFVENDRVVEMHDGEYWPEWVYNDRGGECEATGERYDRDELVVVIMSFMANHRGGVRYGWTNIESLWANTYACVHAQTANELPEGHDSEITQLYDKRLLFVHPTLGVILEIDPRAADDGCRPLLQSLPNPQQLELVDDVAF
jgi:hypothetical protein